MSIPKGHQSEKRLKKKLKSDKKNSVSRRETEKTEKEVGALAPASSLFGGAFCQQGLFAAATRHQQAAAH